MFLNFRIFVYSKDILRVGPKSKSEIHLLVIYSLIHTFHTIFLIVLCRQKSVEFPTCGINLVLTISGILKQFGFEFWIKDAQPVITEY